MITYVNKITVRLIISLIIALPLIPVAQAGNPGDPVAHWTFEEGALQTIINNVNPGTYNGYRGRTSLIEANYDAVWTNGLNGSSYALAFTNSEIATIIGMTDDTNGDRTADSGPLTSSFSIFMRVNMPNADYQMLATADRGPGYPPERGFYFDTNPSGLSGSTYHLGLRISFNSPTNSTWYTTGGASTDIAVTNVESIGFTFKADPDPSDTSNDGTLQFYVNGLPFRAVKTHNAPNVGISGKGLWIGGNFESEPAKGAVIDDIAVWDKVLTADEIMYIETNALPQPDLGPGINPGYPYAHWPLEEGSGEIIRDIRTREVNDGYLGSSPSNTTYNPTWVAGLNGNASALQFDNRDIVVINDIANDTNGDNIADSGPFSGSFTLFARVDLPNTNRCPIYNIDKESPITARGFYMDIYNGWNDGSGNWHVGTRIYSGSPTNSFYEIKNGTADTPLCTNVQTITLSFKADPNTDDSINDGTFDIYMNGELFYSFTHNTSSIGASGNNKFWLARDTYGVDPNGLIMDDVAIWSKTMNENEVYYLANIGVPIQPPAGTTIVIK